MAVFVFLGIHLLLYNEASSGPNLYLFFGWLELHRHGDSWTFEHFHFGGLLVALLLSALLTWFLSKILGRRMV